MWSFNHFMNKLSKAIEENFDDSAENHFNIVNSYTIKQPQNNHSRTSVSSHFIGASLTVCLLFDTLSFFVRCFHQVPHINQQSTWDCGLACVLMVLQALGVYDELVALCCTTSIWTIDLAYLLQSFSVSFTYCTVTLGANPDFSVETFYKDQLPNDLRRVNMLFQEAREAGISIECRSVGAKEISDFILSGKYVAIALVDQHKLSQSQLEDVSISDFYSGDPGYTGHYVVICGYDAVTNEFEIRDPASSRKHERVPSWCLEQAHKSFGTDEDFLLISVEKGKDEGNSLGFYTF